MTSGWPFSAPACALETMHPQRAYSPEQRALISPLNLHHLQPTAVPPLPAQNNKISCNLTESY
ncbi:hypothetical protein GCM10010289_44640 [Streptomyces violascens]|uniref:Uncharacterized protein n=1 Tax=Streptomyces violascens TaxID=67381 RepID=A0ABQ3QXP8_9ACTN|nr:hypothetical protein GCM10010289_44640 [Streptomyces violascens]GHI42056.1 hypothetical protein Sviol_64640 [Streptomyces violascens]